MSGYVSGDVSGAGNNYRWHSQVVSSPQCLFDRLGLELNLPAVQGAHNGMQTGLSSLDGDRQALQALCVSLKALSTVEGCCKVLTMFRQVNWGNMSTVFSCTRALTADQGRYSACQAHATSGTSRQDHIGVANLIGSYSRSPSSLCVPTATSLALYLIGLAACHTVKLELHLDSTEIGFVFAS